MLKTNRWVQTAIMVVGMALLAAAGVSGAAYPLAVDPDRHGEIARLTASDAEGSDYFGYSVALSGGHGRRRGTQGRR